MSRKYKFKFVENVPSDVRAALSGVIEAGPVTISARIGELSRLNPEYEFTEDSQDYVLIVHRKTKAPKAA